MDATLSSDRLARNQSWPSPTATRAPGRDADGGRGRARPGHARGDGRRGPAARISVTPRSRQVRARGDATVHGCRDRTRSGTSRPPASRGGHAGRRSGRLVGAGAARRRSGRRALGDRNGDRDREGAAAPSSAARMVVVTPATLRIASVVPPRRPRGEVTVAAVDGARRPVSRARSRSSRSDGGGRPRTRRDRSAGSARARSARRRLLHGRRRRAPSPRGSRWNGRTPRNRFCPRVAALRRRRRAGRRATPSASRARSRGAGSRSCPRRSA